MPHYRAYQIDKNGDVIGPSSCFECPADEDALEKARTELEAYAIELWATDRRVGFAVPNQVAAKAG
jgi:hypothetical protein